MDLKNYWKVYLCGIVILILSLISGDTVDDIYPWQVPHMDKVAHFLMYFGFSLLILNAYIRAGLNRISRIWRTMVIAILYSGIMEFLQYLIAHRREPDTIDMLFNVLGIIALILSYSFIKKVKVNRYL